MAASRFASSRPRLGTGGSAAQQWEERELWQKDLRFWLNAEKVVRRRQAAAEAAGGDQVAGLGTSIYARGVQFSWVLVFRPNVDSRGKRIYSNMHEAWTICTRLWAAGLTLDYQVSETTGELFLLVGAEQHILADEASQEDGTVVMMRMQEAKGLVKFDPDFKDYYVDRLASIKVFVIYDPHSVGSLLSDLEVALAQPRYVHEVLGRRLEAFLTFDRADLDTADKVLVLLSPDVLKPGSTSLELLEQALALDKEQGRDRIQAIFEPRTWRPGLEQATAPREVQACLAAHQPLAYPPPHGPPPESGGCCGGDDVQARQDEEFKAMLKQLLQSLTAAHTSTCFSSGIRQRLVLRRLNRGILLPLVERMNLPAPDKLIAKLKRKVSELRQVRATFLVELFTAVGAFRDNDEVKRIMGPNVAKAAALAKLEWYRLFTVYPPSEDDKDFDMLDITGHVGDLADLTAEAATSVGKTGMKCLRKVQGKKRVHVGKKEMDKRMAEMMEEMEQEPLTYIECQQMVLELESWYTSGGSAEKFNGSLKKFFPTHDPVQLHTFRRQWARTDLIKHIYTFGRSNEGKYTEGAYYSHQNKMKKQWAFKYQPIDEIRDYFGDKMALYFCWLGTYTDALVWPTLVGLLCSFANWKDGNFDPNQSKYTIVYTLYMSGWTVHFLERWGRKENELRFLWGNEAMTVVQKPRPQFKGVLRINFITNSEKLVADSAGVQFAKRVGSWFLILLVVLFTIFCATAAESLALLGRKPVMRCFTTHADFVERVGAAYNASLHASYDGSVCNASAWSRMACENRDCTYEIEPLPLESLLDVFRNYGWLLTAACSNVFIMFSFEAVFESIAWRLNDWENHRLEQEYQDNLIFKHAVFQFVNNCKAQPHTLAHRDGLAAL